MPLTYDYECTACGSTAEHRIGVEQRDTFAPKCLACGSDTRRLFPIGAQIQTFESYHSEALGIDITGPQQKAEALKAMGLVEAGDPVKGSRNDDTDHPHRITAQPPKGIGLSDWQEAQEKRRAIADNFVAETVDKDGNVVNRQRAAEMKTVSPMSSSERKRKEAQVAKMIGEQTS